MVAWKNSSKQPYSFKKKANSFLKGCELKDE